MVMEQNDGGRIAQDSNLKCLTRMNHTRREGPDADDMKAEQFVLGVQEQHDEFFPIRPEKPLAKHLVNVPGGAELCALAVTFFAFADDFQLVHGEYPFVV